MMGGCYLQITKKVLALSCKQEKLGLLFVIIIKCCLQDCKIQVENMLWLAKKQKNTHLIKY